jgi:hypothetical protein
MLSSPMDLISLQPSKKNNLIISRCRANCVVEGPQDVSGQDDHVRRTWTPHCLHKVLPPPKSTSAGFYCPIVQANCYTSSSSTTIHPAITHPPRTPTSPSPSSSPFLSPSLLSPSVYISTSLLLLITLRRSFSLHFSVSTFPSHTRTSTRSQLSIVLFSSKLYYPSHLNSMTCLS